jgi:DNA-directed RNA polymerase subunit RPC12/RpoP
MQDVIVSCKKCGNKVPSSSLKLDLDLKMVVCPDCIKNKGIHKEVEQEVFHKKEEKEIIEEKFKITHKCASCGFKFKIDPETKKPRNCPYCDARVLGF